MGHNDSLLDSQHPPIKCHTNWLQLGHMKHRVNPQGGRKSQLNHHSINDPGDREMSQLLGLRFTGIQP